MRSVVNSLAGKIPDVQHHSLGLLLCWGTLRRRACLAVSPLHGSQHLLHQCHHSLWNLWGYLRQGVTQTVLETGVWGVAGCGTVAGWGCGTLSAIEAALLFKEQTKKIFIQQRGCGQQRRWGWKGGGRKVSPSLHLNNNHQESLYTLYSVSFFFSPFYVRHEVYSDFMVAFSSLART